MKKAKILVFVIRFNFIFLFDYILLFVFAFKATPKFWQDETTNTTATQHVCEDDKHAHRSPHLDDVRAQRCVSPPSLRLSGGCACKTTVKQRKSGHMARSYGRMCFFVNASSFPLCRLRLCPYADLTVRGGLGAAVECNMLPEKKKEKEKEKGDVSHGWRLKNSAPRDRNGAEGQCENRVGSSSLRRF
jgi:hypothetical protein